MILNLTVIAMTDITKILYDNAALKGIPLGGTFELTPVCNMNCKMCYIRQSASEFRKNGETEIPAEKWLELAYDAQKSGMLYLLLTGGEPFLYSEFDLLYDELKKMGLMISINTNATLLTGERLEHVIKNPPYKINATVYGGSDETYERLCGLKNGYTLATQAVRKLRQAGVYVKINGSITPDNCCDIEKCFDFAREIQSPCQLGSYMFPPVRRENKHTERFDSSEAGYYQAKIDKLRYEEKDFQDIVRKIRICSEQGSSGVFNNRISCRAGRSGFWINWKGEMLACGMTEYFKEYPFKDGFEKSWERIKNQVKNTEVLRKCSECSLRDICKVCPAMAIAETGSFNEKPEYVCCFTDSWKEEMSR